MTEQLAQHVRGHFNNPICKARIKSFLKKSCFLFLKRWTLAFFHNPDKQKTTFNTYIWFGKTLLKRNSLMIPFNDSSG